MIIVKVWGGIGNQLFQYVFGQYLRFRYKQEVCYDDSSYLSTDKLRNSELSALDGSIVFNNKCTFSRYRGVKNRLLRFLFQLNPKHHYVSESNMQFPENYEVSHIYFFQGYWQDVKYYQWLKTNASGFSLKIKEMPQELTSLQTEIRASNNSVCLHVRRGDYFIPQNIGIYGVCDAAYYEKTLNYMSRQIKDMEVFVFSDDIDWIKTNLKFSCPYTIVPNYDVPQFAYISLMSECKNYIISNSSFSWWGAVIGEQEQSCVICPKRWRKDTADSPALANWIKL